MKNSEKTDVVEEVKSVVAGYADNLELGDTKDNLEEVDDGQVVLFILWS